jgi:hypothetical protein
LCHLFTCLPNCCVSVYLIVYLSVCLSVCLFVCPFGCLSIWLSFCLSFVCPLSVHLSFFSACPSLSACLGIIVVMDLCYHPPLTVRLHLPTKSADKVPIQELTWSLDSSRLLSLNSKGVVQLWSMSGHYSHNIKKEASDFSHSSASGYFPCQLKNLMSLTSQDFVFIEGLCFIDKWTDKQTYNLCYFMTFIGQTRRQKDAQLLLFSFIKHMIYNWTDG